MSNYIGNGEVDITKNPHNMFNTYQGRKTMFLHLETNPQVITLNNDLPGDTFNARIDKVLIDDAGTASPYYQLDFENALHKESCLTFGAKSMSVQVKPDSATSGTDMTIPIVFYNNHIPNRFIVTIYGPGEPATPITLDANGAQIWITFDFVVT